jgi:hypothetical protein
MIRIHSTFGEILVRGDGIPYPDTLPEEYSNITKFDLNRLEKFCNSNHIPFPKEWDILGIAYWTDNGHYEHPANDYSEVGYMRHIWRGDADDIDEAIDMNNE